MIVIWAPQVWSRCVARPVRASSRRRCSAWRWSASAGWCSARAPTLRAAPALLYVPVPLLLWAAVRFGPSGLVTSLAIVLTMAIAGAANNLGPFEGRSSPANVFTLQLFLLGVGVPLLLLSAMVGERQKTQARLAQSAERYRVMVRSLPHAAVLLFGVGPAPLVRRWPGPGRFGLPRKPSRTTPSHRRFPRHWRRRWSRTTGLRSTASRTSSSCAHGESQFLVYGVPLSDTTTPTGMLVLHDVTYQKRAEVLAELDRAQDSIFQQRQPRAADSAHPHPRTAPGRARRRLALGLSHSQMVNRNALRLQRLVNALLDFSRIEAGRMNVFCELTDVAALTADLVTNFQPMIERAGLSLVVETPPLPGEMAVYVDRDMWDKIVLNLVSQRVQPHVRRRDPRDGAAFGGPPESGAPG